MDEYKVTGSFISGKTPKLLHFNLTFKGLKMFPLVLNERILGPVQRPTSGPKPSLNHVFNIA